MRNMWSSIPLVNSLNWAKKNSTSRIHPTKLTGKLQGGGNEKVSDIQDCPWTVSIGQHHLKNPPNEVDVGAIPNFATEKEQKRNILLMSFWW